MALLTADELRWLSTVNIGRIVCAQPFSHALTNQVFLLTNENGQQTVFKRLNLKARDRQDRIRELAVQKLASDRGLTPDVLADCEQYRVQTYIKGDILDSASIDSQITKLFAAQLQIIHQLPAKYARPQRLAFELLFLKKRLNKAIDEGKFQRFLQLATQLDKRCIRDTLCHGDLSFSNLLQAENGQIKILDWEYAVLACSAYDLAACSSINAFSSEQQAQLINYYYSLHKDHLSLSLAQLKKECALYLSVFTYLNELWALCFQTATECL